MNHSMACEQPENTACGQKGFRQQNDKFGNESPNTTAHGKILEYLGMTIDYMVKNVCMTT